MIVIAIINWNGADDTVECLESLMRLDHDAFRVIVCDNGSQAPLAPRLRKWAESDTSKDYEHSIWKGELSGPRRHKPTLEIITPEDRWNPDALVTLVEIGWNSGFAHANNQAIKMALSVPETTHVWLLNNDTIVTPETLSNLAKRSAEEPALSIIGSTLVYYHRPDLVQGLGGHYDVRIARTVQIGNKICTSDLPPTAEVEGRLNFVIGASMLLSRPFIETAGLMDERYFLYFEEFDWALRAGGRRRLGWARNSIVYHKEGASIGTDSLGGNSEVAIFYLNRGLLLFYWKHYRILLPMACLKIALNYLRSVRQGERKLACAVLNGARSGAFALMQGKRIVTPESGPPHLQGRQS